MTFEGKSLLDFIVNVVSARMKSLENEMGFHKGLRTNNISLYYLMGDPEVIANLNCNFAYAHWEGCVICSINLR